MLHFTLKAGVSNISPRNQKQPGKHLNLADWTVMININLVFYFQDIFPSHKEFPHGHSHCTKVTHKHLSDKNIPFFHYYRNIRGVWGGLA